MPRKFQPILFDGGLNTAKDPRDLTNQVSDVSGMQFTQSGIIEPDGTLVAPTGVTATISGKAVKGYGLFVFGSDWDMAIKSITQVWNTGNGVPPGGAGDARYETSAAHGLATGNRVFHYNFATAAYNGYKEIVVINATAYDTADTFVDNITGNYLDISKAVNTSNEKYIASADADADAEIDIMSVSDNAWFHGMIDVGTTTGMKAVFYYIDGALRVCDANFGSGNSRKWFGYIKEDIFKVGGSYVTSLDSWYSLDADIAGPLYSFVSGYLDKVADVASTTTTIVDTELENYGIGATPGGTYYAVGKPAGAYAYGTISSASATTPWTITTSVMAVEWEEYGNGYWIYPPAGGGFGLGIESTVDDGGWTGADYEFASTLVYIGNQESLPVVMSGTNTVTITDAKTVEVMVNTTTPYPANVIGGRIYYREADSSDDWKLLIDIDFRKGYRLHSYGAWTGQWAYRADSTLMCLVEGLNQKAGTTVNMTIDTPSIETFKSINGFTQDEQSLSAKFKTVTVLNRRTWIANVKIVNESGITVTLGDRIMYTPSNRFDTFPSSFNLDILPGDGDEFTALQGYNDRLLAFKSETLYIINVAQGEDTGWSLESTHPYMGVEIPAATFKTDIGIAWVNKNGCYFYDGKEIHNLIEDSDGNKILNIATWNSTITADAIIGYDPIRKQLLVLSDCDATVGTTSIFDFATKTWSHEVNDTDFLQYSGDLMTNFAILNNELIIGRYSD